MKHLSLALTLFSTASLHFPLQKRSNFFGVENCAVNVVKGPVVAYLC